MIGRIYSNNIIVGKRGNAKALSLCLFLYIFFSCQTPPDTAVDENNPLFSMVSPEQSGIQFSNDLKEDERQNFLTYPYYYNGGGIAVGDLNGDQLPDLYFTGNMVGDRLYLNKGDFTFEDVSRKAGILQQNLWTTGVSFVDVNNDGMLDIYVCRSGMRGFRNNLLYINQGNSKFVEKAREYGLNDNGYSVQSYFFDYDRDGDLDLYLVNHSAKFFANQEELFALKGNPEPDEADKLYRNDGTTTESGQIHFTEVSQEAGIHHFGFGLSAAIADLTGDGLPDIYVANDFFEPDFVYVNQGDGTFSEQMKGLLGHTSFSSMGSDAADFNNDGLTDLFVCDMQAADNYRKKAHMASMDLERFSRMVKEGYHYQYMQNALQLNTGMQRFSEIAEYAGVEETDWSWGPLFFDMDNDGWKDLFVSNGIRRDIQYKDILSKVSEQLGADRQPNSMDLINNFPVEKLSNYTFRNEADFTFSNQSENWGITFKGFSTGAAYVDLDLDGDLDLVLNNLDDPASIYENTATKKGSSHYLQIELRGSEDNYYGIGARVEIQAGLEKQYQSLQNSRGFQSSVAPLLHFGLGAQDKVEELKVKWPNGKITSLKNVKADQRILVRQDESQLTTISTPLPAALLEEKALALGANYEQQEIPYDDFEKEVLIPHTYSQLGPGIAVGDANGDGREDFFIGGARDFPGRIFTQSATGNFKETNQLALERDLKYEDMDAAFFDADGDGDQDLYVVSGSNEWEQGSPWYQDRLYLNDGKGNFIKNATALPTMHTSGSCVRPCDFDKDGDLDLFVGGRIVPGKYPLPARSYLLQNDAGSFSDVTATFSKELVSPGLVTDATWADYDQDGDSDLMIVGEWMPLTLFANVNSEFVLQESPDLANTAGWWYSLAAADIDRDGDMDYLAGNLGLNYKYKASLEEPFQVFAHDFDANGSLDIVLGYFNQGQLFPLRGKQCSAQQMPSLKEKFPQYAGFASATLEDVYGPENLSQALHHNAYTFASVYIENLGEGQFRLKNLPPQAQFSAVNGIVLTDINGDEALDVILAGNMYQSEAETARNDAGTGLILLGDNKGNFSPVDPQESGFFAPGDVKSLEKASRFDGTELILVGNNTDRLQIFTVKR